MVKFIDVKLNAMPGTAGEGSLDLMIEVDPEMEGSTGTEIWPFHYVPGDRAPVTLAVAKWLKENGGKLRIGQRPKPSTNPADYPLTRRQVRGVFINLGCPADAVEMALEAQPKGAMREQLRADWLETPIFNLTDPVLQAAVEYWIGFDPTMSTGKINKAWMEAVPRRP